MPSDNKAMSIGALSKATGVPTDTLRTWERRYGFPTAERTPSGHRRYSVQTLRRLKLVVRAMALGHRPSSVLSVDESELRELLIDSSGEVALPVDGAPDSQESQDEQRSTIESWLAHVERYDGRQFERAMRHSWASLGAMAFIEQRAAPFLTELGKRWADGRLGVRHEHFASEQMRDFLAQRWRPISDAASGPRCVLATMPAEQHVLGLHLAALTLALNNLRVIFLGADSPPSEIANSVIHHGAVAVVLSAASSADPDVLRQGVEALQLAVDPSVAIVVGGQGFSAAPPGVTHLPDFDALAGWAASTELRMESAAS